MHFKPNIQILSGKGNTVFLPHQNQSNGNHDHASVDPPSLFCNNVQHPNQSPPHEISSSDRIDTSQSITFPALPVRTNDQNEHTRSHLTAGYSGSDSHQQPPTIFSAPLNSTNLLTSGPSNDQQQSTTSNKERATIDGHSNNQTFAHGISIVTSNPVSQYTSSAVTQLVYSHSSNQYSQQQNQNNTVYQVNRKFSISAKCFKNIFKDLLKKFVLLFRHQALQ